MKWNNAIVFSALLAAFVFASCKQQAPEVLKNAKAEKTFFTHNVFIKTSNLFTVKKMTTSLTIEVSGTLEPIRKSTVNTKEDGTCVGFFTPDKRPNNSPGELLPGTKVKKGEVLIELENTILEQQITSLETQITTLSYGVDSPEVNEAESALNIAETNFKRMQELLQKNSISQAQYDKAKMAYQQAKAGYDKLLLNLEALKKNLAVLKKRQQNLLVKAPFDGRIQQVLINPGEKATSMMKTPVFVIVDDSLLDFTFGVPEQYAIYLDKNTRVKITLPNGLSVECTLTSVAPTVNPLNRNFQCKARIKGVQAGRQIPAGIFAKGEITMLVEGIFVPASAIVSNEDTDYCFVRNTDNKNRFDKVRVKRGVVAKNLVQLLGSAIPENSEIVENAKRSYLTATSILLEGSNAGKTGNY